MIVDKKESGRYLGRTEFDSVEVDNEVVINTGKRLPIGDFVNVKISKVESKMTFACGCLLRVDKR